jgi:hypothetical protein
MKDEALAEPVYVKTFHGGKPWPLHPEPAAQRQWVGLTDEEIKQMGLDNYRQVVREVEAKLKELNI